MRSLFCKEEFNSFSGSFTNVLIHSRSLRDNVKNYEKKAHRMWRSPAVSGSLHFKVFKTGSQK